MADAILVTGADGEVGHGLIPQLAKTKAGNIIALDINELDETLKPHVHETTVADILDGKIIEKLLKNHRVTTVYHLAAILSTAAEKNPEAAHDVNVGGTLSLLAAVNAYAIEQKQEVKFLFPSSIAVYGIPNLETKQKMSKLKEEDFNTPITMYGINKLYGEMLGTYYSTNYKMLDIHHRPSTAHHPQNIDFRCLRFPGIISALTTPTGGTSDYAPEMIHSAARGEGYESFVRPDTQIPFMVMPDAVKALLTISQAPRENLKSCVYNVSGFSATSQEIADLVNKVFPDSAISYKPDMNRQKIVDSWPSDIDDSKARSDWGWQPDYDLNRAFNDYLIPEIQNKYK